MSSGIALRLRDLVFHRHSRQIGEILLYLGVSRCIAVFATAWATRCLGAHNLGISGMIGATLGQMNLLIILHLETLWIRRYKAAPNEAARDHLVSLGLTQRFIFST